jgi:hypothetical protein
MDVTIYHNISRDSGFGLNQVLVKDPDAPAGYRKDTLPGSHPLVKVFTYSVDELTRHQDELHRAFERFNVGEDTIAQAYRARRLRSLSVGDVVAFAASKDQDAAIYSVGPWDFSPVKASDLRVLQGDEAVQAIRTRYDFRPSETELTVTVPLA